MRVDQRVGAACQSLTQPRSKRELASRWRLLQLPLRRMLLVQLLRHLRRVSRRRLEHVVREGHVNAVVRRDGNVALEGEAIARLPVLH